MSESIEQNYAAVLTWQSGVEHELGPSRLESVEVAVDIVHEIREVVHTIGSPLSEEIPERRVRERLGELNLAGAGVNDTPPECDRG
jgi:hypothetical protein